MRRGEAEGGWEGREKKGTRAGEAGDTVTALTAGMMQRDKTVRRGGRAAAALVCVAHSPPPPFPLLL